MGHAHIRLQALTKRFEQVVAVDRLNLEIEKGCFTTLLGPSGCGKTTTLRLIAGFQDPDEGTIFLGERSINRLPAHKRGVAMVFQSYALFPHMNVYNNIAYGLRLKKWSRGRIREKVREVLELVGMPQLEKRQPNQLSGGQQQRVAVARALALEPEVLLMDEPLSNLDAKLRITIRNEIKQLQKRLQMTTIYVTHDQEEALALSDQIAVLKEGRLQQLGTPWQVYNQPANQFVADFMGITNFLQGVIVDMGSDQLGIEVGGLQLKFSCNESVELTPGQQVTAHIRPESITLAKDPPENKSSRNWVQGNVYHHSYLGQIVRYWIDIEGGLQLITQEHNPERILQDTVYLHLNGDQLVLLPDEADRAVNV